jgi:hypothetical protein
MRKTTAANLALVLSPFGAILLLVAMGNVMGDLPYPASPEEMARKNFASTVELFAFTACVLSCFWLSGFSYSEAPYRSLLSAAVAIAGLITVSVVI